MLFLEDSVLLDAENGKGIFIGNNTIIRRFTTILSSGSEYLRVFKNREIVPT